MAEGRTIFEQPSRTAGEAGDPDEIFVVVYDTTGTARKTYKMNGQQFATAIGATGVTDGDKGDITVSGSGATYTIDAGAVTTAKIQDAAVTYAKLQSVTASRLLGRGDSGAGAPQEITIGANLTLTGTTLAATAGGTPAGASTQVQFNNSGAFGASSGLTWSGTGVAIASGSLAGASAPGISITQTWNNAATTFTGSILNVTDTASNAASKLLDLQVGGVTRFSVDKSGNIFSAATGSVISDMAVTWNSAGTTLDGIRLSVTDTASATASNFLRFRIGTTDYVRVQKDGSFFWTSSTSSYPLNFTGSSNLTMIRSVNGIIYYGNAADTVSGSSNFIQSQNAAGIRFGTNNAGRWMVTATGDLQPIPTASTSMTAGFPYIPAAAGVPSGVPSGAGANVVPMYYDTTNNRIYVYSGGTWRSVALT